MATNFPGSLDSYTTKNAGDTISEGHVNNLQDAVVAAETKVGIGADTPVSGDVFKGTGTGTSGWAVLTTTDLPAGSVVQVVNVMNGAVATGTTAMTRADTIPVKTEGDEYMTLAITPKSATNKLKIDVVWNGIGANDYLTIALFQDATTNALAAVHANSPGDDSSNVHCFTHFMVAGTTSATTFKVRAGSVGATTTFNGWNSGRIFGGVMASSITITEVKA